MNSSNYLIYSLDFYHSKQKVVFLNIIKWKKEIQEL